MVQGRFAFVSLLRNLPLLQASLQLSPHPGRRFLPELSPACSRLSYPIRAQPGCSLTMAKQPEWTKRSVDQDSPTPWYHMFTKGDPEYDRYMAEEWGFEVHDDRKLFEMIILEGAQAGLSWKTILSKRDAYRAAFHNFDIKAVAAMSEADQQELLKEGSGIVKNKLKVKSAIANAKVALEIQKEEGSLDKFLWSFIPDGKPLLNQRKEFVTETEEARAMSAALKKRGMNFVGPTIIYAFMQACGMVVDHPLGTPEWEAAKARLEAAGVVVDTSKAMGQSAGKSKVQKAETATGAEESGKRGLRKRAREEDSGVQGAASAKKKQAPAVKGGSRKRRGAP